MSDDFIANNLQRYLSRKSVPTSLQGKQAAQMDEIAALAAAVARYCPKDGSVLLRWWQAVTDTLDESISHRAWPTVEEISKACKRHAADFVGGRQRAESATEKVRRGLYYDLREARFKGEELDADEFKIAREQRPTRNEWKHHIGVLAKIWGITEDDAEQRELTGRGARLGPISDDQLPEHLAHRGAGVRNPNFTAPEFGPVKRFPQAPAAE